MPAREPLPGRECGSCNVCCVHILIDDEELQKLPGCRCEHLTKDHGCGIHATRPRICRNWECGWKLFKWIKPQLRPDRSGVMVVPHNQTEADGSRTAGISFVLLRPGALNAPSLADVIATAVDAGLPVFLSVPGPPGFTSGMGRVDQVFAAAVAARDKPALQRLIREAYARARGNGREHVPVELRHGRKPPLPAPPP